MPRRKTAGAEGRRRHQNAEAQRTYRKLYILIWLDCISQLLLGAKQKSRVQTLEQMVVSALSRKVSCGSNQLEGTELIPLPSVRDGSTTRSLDLWNSSVGFTTLEFYQSLYPSSEEEKSRCYNIVAKENFTLRDIIKYGLIAMGYSMDPAIFHSALSLPSRNWIELVQSNYSNVNITQVVSSGVKLLAQLNGPHEWPTLESFQPQCPNVYANNITLIAVSCLSAMWVNILHLKIIPEEVARYDGQSRFCI
jgi:WD40 repeat protein